MNSTTSLARTQKESPEEKSSNVAAARARKKAEAAYDSVLVGRFNGGDEAAFTEIIKRYYPQVRALAQQTLHNAADAEEVTQDTFIRAHRGLSKFRGDASLATWLYCIGLNLSRNRYWYMFRRHRQDTISIDQTVMADSNISLAEVVAAGPENPCTETVRSEFMSLVASCMERLDLAHREILTMRSVRELSYEEIATSLKISVGTVKSRIARARESLRTLLMRMAPEFGREAEVCDFFECTREIPRPTAA